MYDTMPHLILVDIDLPGIDGYSILEKKQAEPLLAKIPVFLMSTQGVPINMRDVPKDSVAEFIIALHADTGDIVEKIDRFFNHEAMSSQATAPDAGGEKKKLLWVEDDKLIGTILAKKLVSAGFDLFHAKNGEEAMEALKASKPDAIVIDLLLPGMSGFDILQKINTDEVLKKIPCMVLSNLSKPSDIEKARILGAKKFLVKAATSLDQIVEEVRELYK
jgi:CheY-like chemotaxis protein